MCSVGKDTATRAVCMGATMVSLPFWSLVLRGDTLALLPFIFLMRAQHNGGKAFTTRTSKNSRKDLFRAS